jgi:hypothetical protein|eukprot:COSAG02_NODE_22835_length_739_cov_0.868750_1_plen_101_part_00
MDMPDTDPADPANHKGLVHPLMEPGDVRFTSTWYRIEAFCRRSAPVFQKFGLWNAQVIFFMGGATAHGAWATHTDKPRRVALFNYLSKEIHYFTRPVAAL